MSYGYENQLFNQQNSSLKLNVFVKTHDLRRHVVIRSLLNAPRAAQIDHHYRFFSLCLNYEGRRPHCCHRTTLCLKNVTTLSCHNYDTHEPSLIILGRNVTEKVSNQKTHYFPTSSNMRFHTTWQSRRDGTTVLNIIRTANCRLSSILTRRCERPLSRDRYICRANRDLDLGFDFILLRLHSCRRVSESVKSLKKTARVLLAVRQSDPGGQRSRLKVKPRQREVGGGEQVAVVDGAGGRRVVEVRRQVERGQRGVRETAGRPDRRRPPRAHRGPPDGQLEHLGGTGRRRRRRPGPRGRRAAAVGPASSMGFLHRRRRLAGGGVGRPALR